MSTPDPVVPAMTGAARRVVLVLDPVTHAELQRAAGHRDVESYLYVLAGRYARWSELREWLSQLEASYGPVPPEALEGLHRRMLGLPRRAADGNRRLTVSFSAEEFGALGAAAGERPIAAYVRDLLTDRLTTPQAAVAGSEPAAPETGAPIGRRAEEADEERAAAAG
ncbi:hypothetical protein [Nocardiopsis mwathae]|nr:hypothetical protein [Nocardiopsis mwathae]